MDKLDIPKTKRIFDALSNKKRVRIIELCSEKVRTVTELSKLLRLDYSIAVRYTSMLANVNLVEKTRNPDRTVNVRSLVRLNSDGEIKKIP